MGSVLIVCFSRTGFTRKIAEELQRRCGGDLEFIEDVRSRSGVFGYLRSAREAWRKAPVEIRPGKANPGQYELTILGTPVWAGNLSSPMRAYIDAHGTALRRVAFFCTLGGSGADKVMADMTQLCGKKPVATAAITDSEIKNGRYAAVLDEFVAAIARVGVVPRASPSDAPSAPP
jgi:flavodoxin